MANHVTGGLLFGLAATVVATTAEAATLPADCTADPAGALGNALAMAAPFDVIEINGTCTQNVDILIDDLTIQGVGGGATIAGQLVVNGARRVTIQNLALQGEGTPGLHGVSALNGAAVTIFNVMIQKFINGNGVHLEDGSRVLLDQVTIQESGGGVLAQSNAAVEVTNVSVIEDNSGAGIELDLGSSGIVNGSTIQNNGSTGISVFRGSSAVLFGNTIQGNPEGISVNTHATAWLNGNTISNGSADEDALFIGWGSSVRMNGENTLTSGGSAIFLRQGATLNQRR
jgi:parallel beta-helix repeat protein